MKTKMKRIGAMVLACVMLWGVSVGVSAENLPGHTCAFSYMGTERYATTRITYHTYLDGNGNVQTCEVRVKQFRDIYKCACGETEYRNQRGVVEHTGDCGQ